MQNQKGLPAQAGNIVLIIAGIVAVAILAGGVGYFVAKKPAQKEEQKQETQQQEQQKSISEITEQKTKQPEVIDETADWQYYDHEKEGVNSVVLPNFKYPNNWFTTNISGGQMVEIMFSDKNIIVGQQNDCMLSIVFNGNQNKYSIAEINKKQIISEKSECDKILPLMKSQVNY